MLRKMILTQAIEQWFAFRNAQHSTRVEKQMADIAMDELRLMLKENEKRENDRAALPADVDRT